MGNAPSGAPSLAKLLCALTTLVGGCTPSAAPVTSRPAPVSTADDEWAGPRRQMGEQPLAARRIHNARVLATMGRVPRHEFVPEDVRPDAYDDRPLPIGHGQTISQPYIVAFMTEAVDPQPGQRVLEVGTGSGYQAAILAELVG